MLYILNGVIFSVLSFFAIVFVVRVIRSVRHLKEEIRRRQMYPALRKMTVDDMCKGVHKWDHMALSLKGLRPGRRIICYHCGLITGDWQGFYGLNAPGLKVYQAKRELRAQRLLRGETDEDDLG